MLGIGLLILVIFIFGTIIGSFLNVLIWRLPQEMKITGRSFCPNCKHALGVLDLIPVLSFVFSRGKCRHCGHKVSWRYPVIEITTGLLFVLTALLVLLPTWSFDVDHLLIAIKMAFIISVLIVVFVIDLEHYLILDKVVFPATAVIILFALLVDFLSGNLLAFYSLWMGSVIGAIAGFLPFYLIWWFSKGKWIGLGDAKYGLFLGAVFGFPFVYLVYFLACFLGTLLAIPLLVSGRKHLSSKLPLGTFLSVGALLTLWFGLAIISWYFGLIGLA